MIDTPVPPRVPGTGSERMKEGCRMVSRWERLQAREAGGEWMYPIHRTGARTDPTLPGGIIHVFAVEPDLDNWSHDMGERRGFITWRGSAVEFVQVEESYRRKGIATELFRLAQSVCPDLRHSSDLSDEARTWIAGMEAKRAQRGSSADEGAPSRAIPGDVDSGHGAG